MRVRWTPSAADDLASVKEYLDENYPHLSHSTMIRLFEAVRSLKKLPRRGRIGIEAGARELILRKIPYIVVHRVGELAVEVLRIRHGRRSYAPDNVET